MLAASVIAAGFAVAVLVLNSTVQTQPARASVSFRTAADGEIVATVRNPFSSANQLDAAFAAHGLRITVNEQNVFHPVGSILATLPPGNALDDEKGLSPRRERVG